MNILKFASFHLLIVLGALSLIWSLFALAALSSSTLLFGLITIITYKTAFYLYNKKGVKRIIKIWNYKFTKLNQRYL